MARTPTPQPAVDPRRILASLERTRTGMEEVRASVQKIADRQNEVEDRVSQAEIASDANGEKLDAMSQRFEVGMEHVNAVMQNGWRAVDTKLASTLADIADLAAQIHRSIETGEGTRALVEANNPQAISMAAEGAASGVVKATQDSWLKTLLNSKAAWIVAVSTGFTAIVSASKNIPPFLRFIGHTIMAIAQMKGG